MLGKKVLVIAGEFSCIGILIYIGGVISCKKKMLRNKNNLAIENVLICIIRHKCRPMVQLLTQTGKYLGNVYLGKSIKNM